MKFKPDDAARKEIKYNRCRRQWQWDDKNLSGSMEALASAAIFMDYMMRNNPSHTDSSINIEQLFTDWFINHGDKYT